jgi:hypothetical protein
MVIQPGALTPVGLKAQGPMMPLVRLLLALNVPVLDVARARSPAPTDREIVPRFTTDVLEPVDSEVTPPVTVTDDGAVMLIPAATLSVPPASCRADVPRPVALLTVSVPDCTVVVPL